MGFWDKVKQFVGIGGVKVSLEVGQQFPKASKAIDGKVRLTAKSDQEVSRVEIKLIETWTTGRGDEKSSKDYDLGVTAIEQRFTLKAGEVKELTFKLPFSLLKSNAEELKEKGGALGALGKVAVFANAEKSTYRVTADAAVKGTAFNPSADKRVELV